MKKFWIPLVLASALNALPLFASPAPDSDLGLDRRSSDIAAPARAADGVEILALNQDTTLGGRPVAKGTEVIADETGALLLVGANSELVDSGARLENLDPSLFTRLTQNEQTGEIEPYNLPDDFLVAGPGGHRGHHGGVTNCYHAVKALVRRRISLSGVAAYEAAPQLEHAGWHRFDYGSAPRGSVCVFGAGGEATASGGQRYGHIGVKGAGGIANPESGFHLNRPFLGCWHE